MEAESFLLGLVYMVEDLEILVSDRISVSSSEELSSVSVSTSSSEDVISSTVG